MDVALRYAFAFLAGVSQACLRQAAPLGGSFSKPLRCFDSFGSHPRCGQGKDNPANNHELETVRDSLRAVASRLILDDSFVPRCQRVLPCQNPDEGSEARVHYALSNASADTDPGQLVLHGVHRYWIERNFQDAKSEAGLADYQVRGWLGWHHHMARVMFSMLFILREKPLHAPGCRELSLNAVDVFFLLTQLLSRRIETTDDALDILKPRRHARLYDQRRTRERITRSRPLFPPLEDLTR